MNREEFLSKFGISLVAVCAGGCLASCGKSEVATPNTPNAPVTPPPSGVSFTIDLNNEIRSVGESKTVSGVLVVRLATGNAVSSFTAVQVACTHQGTSVAFSTSQSKFICPNHGAEFSTTGVILNAAPGRATTSLKAYNVAVSGSTLTVTG